MAKLRSPFMPGLVAVHISDLLCLKRLKLFLVGAITQSLFLGNGPNDWIEVGNAVDDQAAVVDGKAAGDRLRLYAALSLLAKMVRETCGREVRVYETGPRGGVRRLGTAEIERRYQAADQEQGA